MFNLEENKDSFVTPKRTIANPPKSLSTDFNMATIGLPTNDIMNLVNQIDNVLKHDANLYTKTDSTLDREIPKFTPMAKSTLNMSQIKVQSTYQPQISSSGIIPKVNYNNQINLNDSYVIKHNNFSAKRPLDAILKDITKINSDLDFMSYKPAPTFCSKVAPAAYPTSQYSSSKPAYTPSTNYSQYTNFNKENQSLDSLINNIVNLSKQFKSKAPGSVLNSQRNYDIPPTQNLNFGNMDRQYVPLNHNKQEYHQPQQHFNQLSYPEQFTKSPNFGEPQSFRQENPQFEQIDNDLEVMPSHHSQYQRDSNRETPRLPMNSRLNLPVQHQLPRLHRPQSHNRPKEHLADPLQLYSRKTPQRHELNERARSNSERQSDRNIQYQSRKLSQAEYNAKFERRPQQPVIAPQSRNNEERVSDALTDHHKKILFRDESNQNLDDQKSNNSAFSNVNKNKYDEIIEQRENMHKQNLHIHTRPNNSSKL